MPISCRGRSPTSPSRPWTQLGLAHRLLDDLGEVQRRAAGRVLLEAVVPLDDLDVEPLALEQPRPRRRTSLNSTLTTRLMFGAKQHGRLRGRRPRSRPSAAVGVPGRGDDERDLAGPRTTGRTAIVPSGTEKSMTHVELRRRAAGRSVTGTPSGPDAGRPRRRPGPGSGCAGRSRCAGDRALQRPWSSLAPGRRAAGPSARRPVDRDVASSCDAPAAHAYTSIALMISSRSLGTCTARLANVGPPDAALAEHLVERLLVGACGRRPSPSGP